MIGFLATIFLSTNDESKEQYTHTDTDVDWGLATIIMLVVGLGLVAIIFMIWAAISGPGI